jgi:restriction system protein
MGFLAEMQREAERRRKAEEREHRRAQREYEKALREAERQAARDEKERKKLYAESRLREAENLNSALERSIEGLESLLSATLRVDDFIDLNALKQTYVEPPFEPGSLASPIPKPELEHVPPPGTLAALVPGTKAKFEAATQQAQEAYETDLAAVLLGYDLGVLQLVGDEP